MSFSHFDSEGQAVMVDVSGKQPTLRTAAARATVRLGTELLQVIQSRGVAKGDVLGVARLAGITAVKKTPELIPLAHPLQIHHVAIDFVPFMDTGEITVTATVRAHERTGVEMEAMVAASVAALTVYDMCKGHNKGISIGEIVLLYKEGGKSGVYRREERS